MVEGVLLILTWFQLGDRLCAKNQSDLAKTACQGSEQLPSLRSRRKRKDWGVSPRANADHDLSPW